MKKLIFLLGCVLSLFGCNAQNNNLGQMNYDSCLIEADIFTTRNIGYDGSVSLHAYAMNAIMSEGDDSAEARFVEIYEESKEVYGKSYALMCLLSLNRTGHEYRIDELRKFSSTKILYQSGDVIGWEDTSRLFEKIFEKDYFNKYYRIGDLAQVRNVTEPDGRGISELDDLIDREIQKREEGD